MKSLFSGRQILPFVSISKTDMLQVGDILISEYSPRRAKSDKSDTRALADRLAKWELQLPDQLQKRPLEGLLNASFWASMLHFAYQ